MKIAVLADLHANYIALQTIHRKIEEWQPDFVVINGDIVNRGPRPQECLDFITQRCHEDGWLAVRGNHEDYVIHQSSPDAPIGQEAIIHYASHWTAQQLNFEVDNLRNLPILLSLFIPSGQEARFVHGSMKGNRDGIYPETRPEGLDSKLGLREGNNTGALMSLFCVGHTHRPLVRRHRDTLVVNAGSAGLPFDGDIRPAYAQLTYRNSGWQAEIIRVNYDLQAAERDIFDSGYFDNAGPLARIVHIELIQARSLLYYWSIQYHDQVLEQKISMEQSVDQFIQRIEG